MPLFLAISRYMLIGSHLQGQYTMDAGTRGARIETPLWQSYIRNMNFEVVLPECDARSVFDCKDTVKDQECNHRAFSALIFHLLNTMLR